MPVIEGVFQIGGQLIHHVGGDSWVSGNFSSDAVEGVKKEVGIELKSDELEFHLLYLRFSIQLLDLFLLHQEFCFEPKIGEGPGQVDKPHENGKESPSLPDGDCLAEACGGPSQIEKGDKEDLQDSGVKGSGQTGDQEGLENKTGAVSP